MDGLIVFCASYLYLFSALIAVIYFFREPLGTKKRMAIAAAVIAPLAFVISRIAGRFYYDPRPFAVANFTPLIAHVADNGFPSDHTLLTAAVAMIVWFFNKRLSAVLWAFALVVGWARVAAGIHHVTDIAGSIAIVIISGAAYYFFVERRGGRSTGARP